MKGAKADDTIPKATSFSDIGRNWEGLLQRYTLCQPLRRTDELIFKNLLELFDNTTLWY